MRNKTGMMCLSKWMPVVEKNYVKRSKVVVKEDFLKRTEVVLQVQETDVVKETNVVV